MLIYVLRCIYKFRLGGDDYGVFVVLFFSFAAFSSSSNNRSKIVKCLRHIFLLQQELGIIYKTCLKRLVLPFQGLLFGRDECMHFSRQVFFVTRLAIHSAFPFLFSLVQGNLMFLIGQSLIQKLSQKIFGKQNFILHKNMA